MTGGSLGLRTGSYASLHQHLQNGALQNSPTSLLVYKSSKANLSSSRERERVIPLFCRYFGRRRVAMLLLFILALLVFVFGSFAVNRGLFSSISLLIYGRNRIAQLSVDIFLNLLADDCCVGLILINESKHLIVKHSFQ